MNYTLLKGNTNKRRGYSTCFLIGVLLSLPAQPASVVMIGDSLSADGAEGPKDTDQGFGASLFNCLIDSKLFSKVKSEASSSGTIQAWSPKNPTFKSPKSYRYRYWQEGSKPKFSTENRVVRNFKNLFNEKGEDKMEIDENSWTVIQLGTNNIGYPKNSISEYVKNLLATKKTKNCLWILPPGTDPDKGGRWRKTIKMQNEAHEAIKTAATAAGCFVHDSTKQIAIPGQGRKVKTYAEWLPKGDGLHFGTAQIARDWAKDACETLKNAHDKTTATNATESRQGNESYIDEDQIPSKPVIPSDTGSDGNHTAAFDPASLDRSNHQTSQVISSSTPKTERCPRCIK